MSAPAPIAPEEVRRVVAARALGVDGVTLSTTHLENFRDPKRSPVHLELAVGVPSTVHQSGRQTPGAAVLVTTELRVVLAWQLRPHDGAASGDEAIALEGALRSHLLGVDPTYPVGFGLVWQRHERRAGAPGWLYLEGVFLAHHYMTLA